MCAQEDQVWDEDADHNGEPRASSEGTSDGEEAGRGYRHGDGTAEDHHLPVEMDSTGDNRSEP
jgi:hypothetical protein